MSDLALRLPGQISDSVADLATRLNDLEQDGGLEAAILLSLFTDRRAEDNDILPTGESDRRGWWGDAHPVVEGDRIGSRLWLLSREKETTATLTRAQEYAQEALAWLVEDKVAATIDVTATVVSRGVLGLSVLVHRPEAGPVSFRFNYNWSAQIERG